MGSKKTGFVQRWRGAIAADELKLGKAPMIPTQLLFSYAQSATQYGAEVQVQVCDSDGNIIPGAWAMDVWLSDNADGSTLAAAAPNTSAGVKAANGLSLGALTANKAFRIITKSDGTATIALLDDATPVLLYVGASLPSLGIIAVSRKTVAGDYKP
jgi:hypothetical protein